MPELPEIEFYRRHAEAHALRRTISAVSAEDEWFLKRGTTADQLQSHLCGTSFVHAKRIGKLLLIGTERDDLVGLRFGMTGVLVIDDVPGVSDLQYSSHRFLPEWNRFSVQFDDGGTLAINDPRRLGGVEFDPDLSKAGIDALVVDGNSFQGLKRGVAPMKSWLLDQTRVAGIGNLIADELLWRVGVSPLRPASSLSDDEVVSLGGTLASLVAELIERGGCHKGDIVPERKKGGRCPLDGTELESRRIGGRMSYWCPQHQR
jgi:formamidopyrimidine-DNA glycosylase